MPPCRASYLRIGRGHIWRGAALACAAMLALGSGAGAQGLVSEGDVVLTQFFGLRLASGLSRPNPDGAVARVFSLASPGQAPDGSVVEDPGLLFTVTARDVGQVFGIAFDDAPDPNIYLAASSAYGLYRDDGEWAEGMWGDEGPGTVWKLDAGRGYAPVPFANVAEDNGGAALGDLAFDPWHGQLLVSDLESGLIHRVDIETGEVLGSFDHGADGRPAFFDAQSGEEGELAPVPRDASAEPAYEDCEAAGASGEPATFQEAPECWNFADFRRRVWGLGVMRDPDEGTVRVYYAVWGGAALGSAEWEEAGEEARTSVWSIALDERGAFDFSEIRREFTLLPAGAAGAGEAAASAPVTDIAFTDDGGMVLAERKLPWLATADEGQSISPARIFAADRDEEGVWTPVEQDLERAGAVPAGGVATGPGFTGAGETDPEKGAVWLTLDGLCDEEGACVGGKRRAQAVDDPTAGIAAIPDTVMFPEDELPEGAPTAAYAVIIDDAGTRAGSVGDVETYGGGDPSMRIAEAGLPADSEPAETGQPAAETGQPTAEEPARAEEDPEAREVAEPLEEADTAEVTATEAPGDLAVILQGPELCEPGEECTFEVSLENEGDEDFAGPLLLTGLPGAPRLSLGPDLPEDWSCAMADSAVFCGANSLTIAAGETMSFEVPLALSEDFRSPRLEYCTSLTWLAEDGRDQVRAVQARLRHEDYDPGPVDGALGPRTRQEIAKAQASFDLPETGEITGAFIERLFGEGSYLSGDGGAGNDRDCFPVTIDLPADSQVRTAPPEPAQTGQRPPRMGYHSYDRSIYHDPSTSAPAEWHGPRSSEFHDRRGSAMHDWRSSSAVGMHSFALSDFHRGYDSRAHDSATTGMVSAHWPAMSSFHSRFNSGLHDGVATRLVPPHDPNTSYMIPMRGERRFDLFAPERRVETEGPDLAQSSVSPSEMRRPQIVVPQYDTNTNRALRNRQMDQNRIINDYRLQERMRDTREKQSDDRRIYNPFLER